MPTADADILGHVKRILRRDLKLGPDVAIADDMPFFGGDVDLDSLDMLLVVSSIEKEFGIKIANESVGRAVFQNVSTLADFVAGQGGKVKTTEPPPITRPGMANPIDRLPHKAPFLFVSKLVSLNEGQSAEGIWTVSGKEFFFEGHFPGFPVVPGVLLTEALAQIAGLAGSKPDEGKGQGKLASIDVRFDSAVEPPADILLTAKVTRVLGPLQRFEVNASVAGKTAARGTLTLFRG